MKQRYMYIHKIIEEKIEEYLNSEKVRNLYQTESSNPRLSDHFQPVVTSQISLCRAVSDVRTFYAQNNSVFYIPSFG